MLVLKGVDFVEKPLASSRAEANVAAFYASGLDTLQGRAARSSASLTRRAVLSRVTTTFRAEVSAVSIAVAQAASAMAAASRA
jgi:hypothetical protein